MQYYLGNGPIGGRNVSQIITNVVRGLAADPKRRFSYVEQAFFQVSARVSDAVRLSCSWAGCAAGARVS